MIIFYSGHRPERICACTPEQVFDDASVMVTYFELNEETRRKQTVECFKRHMRRRRKGKKGGAA